MPNPKRCTVGFDCDDVRNDVTCSTGSAAGGEIIGSTCTVNSICSVPWLCGVRHTLKESKGPR